MCFSLNWFQNLKLYFQGGKEASVLRLGAMKDANKNKVMYVYIC